MIKFNSIIRSIFIVSFVVFAASCTDPNEGVLNSIDHQTSLDAENLVAEKRANAANTKMYTADLAMLNESGVSGTAEITLTRNEITVKIQATGLEPNKLHPQHIHGFIENRRNATCPPPSADTNGDGIIDLVEGLPFYGPIIQDLYVPIDTYPMAVDGDIDYERTKTLGETEFVEEGQVATYSELRPLQNRTIVLHGMTVDGEYVATLPVACGQITVNQGNNNKN